MSKLGILKQIRLPPCADAATIHEIGLAKQSLVLAIQDFVFYEAHSHGQGLSGQEKAEYRSLADRAHRTMQAHIKRLKDLGAL